jgi:hypothetical protein
MSCSWTLKKCMDHHLLDGEVVLYLKISLKSRFTHGLNIDHVLLFHGGVAIVFESSQRLKSDGPQ